MHSCYYYFLIFVSFIQISMNNIVGLKIDNTIRLINESLISSLLTEKSIIESYEYGKEVLELDEDKVIYVINNLVNENLKFTNAKVGFYFYDCFTKEEYKENYNKCNAVQIKIELIYLNKRAERIIRYELV